MENTALWGMVRREGARPSQAKLIKLTWFQWHGRWAAGLLCIPIWRQGWVSVRPNPTDRGSWPQSPSQTKSSSVFPINKTLSVLFYVQKEWLFETWIEKLTGQAKWRLKKNEDFVNFMFKSLRQFHCTLRFFFFFSIIASPPASSPKY